MMPNNYKKMIMSAVYFLQTNKISSLNLVILCFCRLTIDFQHVNLYRLMNCLYPVPGTRGLYLISNPSGYQSGRSKYIYSQQPLPFRWWNMKCCLNCTIFLYTLSEMSGSRIRPGTIGLKWQKARSNLQFFSHTKLASSKKNYL